ncbi:MAG TPA: TIGR03435 family protein [Bryobacteraceae bacterium]|nr:TIGR03435 family protein [Bryobacteraceae bacterium]
MKKTALSFAMATLTLAQTPGSEKRAEFEVASIKPTATKDGSFTYDFPPGGRFTARNLTVKILLQAAYSLEDHQISGGPDWMTTAGFDIQAKAAASAGDVPRGQVLRMVQALLADRFHLVLHRETKQLPVYALVVGKNGHRLMPAGSNVGQTQTRMGQLIVQKMGMAELARILALDLKRPVRDDTGLPGEFAFRLEWTRGLEESDPGPSARPSLFTAVQEQLGLKLEAAKGPIEVFVVEHVEKPSEN